MKDWTSIIRLLNNKLNSFVSLSKIFVFTKFRGFPETILRMFPKSMMREAFYLLVFSISFFSKFISSLSSLITFSFVYLFFSFCDIKVSTFRLTWDIYSFPFSCFLSSIISFAKILKFSLILYFESSSFEKDLFMICSSLSNSFFSVVFYYTFVSLIFAN